MNYQLTVISLLLCITLIVESAVTYDNSAYPTVLGCTLDKASYIPLNSIDQILSTYDPWRITDLCEGYAFAGYVIYGTAFSPVCFRVKPVMVDNSFCLGKNLLGGDETILHLGTGPEITTNDKSSIQASYKAIWLLGDTTIGPWIGWSIIDHMDSGAGYTLGRISQKKIINQPGLVSVDYGVDLGSETLDWGLGVMVGNCNELGYPFAMYVKIIPANDASGLPEGQLGYRCFSVSSIVDFGWDNTLTYDSDFGLYGIANEFFYSISIGDTVINCKASLQETKVTCDETETKSLLSLVASISEETELELINTKNLGNFESLICSSTMSNCEGSFQIDKTTSVSKSTEWGVSIEVASSFQIPFVGETEVTVGASKSYGTETTEETTVSYALGFSVDSPVGSDYIVNLEKVQNTYTKTETISIQPIGFIYIDDDQSLPISAFISSNNLIELTQTTYVDVIGYEIASENGSGAGGEAIVDDEPFDIGVVEDKSASNNLIIVLVLVTSILVVFGILFVLSVVGVKVKYQ